MYAIVECVNSNYFIRAEGITTIESAKAQYHDRCKVLWNAPDVIKACVMIVNEHLDVVDGCREFIHHEVADSE